MDKLFRKKSLLKLNNPEKLNNVFQIVSPQNWIILISLILLLSMIAAWSIWGHINTVISGNGILINRGQNIYDAVVESSGRLLTVNVSEGDVVKKGQQLATLNLPLLSLEAENQKQILSSLQQQQQHLKQFIDTDLKLEQKNNEELQKNWANDLKNADLHLQYLKKALDEREKLVDKVVSRQELADLKSDYYKELQSRAEISRKMMESTVEFNRRAETNRQRLVDINLKILQAQLDLAISQRKLKLNSVITSPVDGEIINITGKPGELVQSGDKILDIEPNSEHVDAAIYVPAGMGKKIVPGMIAQIVPQTVKKQEYGSIIGVVESVSRFPSSQRSMMSVLANEKLVENFTQAGPQLYVRVNLIEANTLSGYKWTTSNGPNMAITNGTLCTANIITKTQAPITLLIPSLKQILGVD
ncbi:NHLP bacteriocin system secretion protein [Legionella fallonii]|uniref:Putative Membrane-fusion protein n=1 Tax=Legionella fallonii LLAP-10 TaxID=1212491 RepID=A0A098G257_9GAMM|nr:NHLP bacteriocin system secretion protein [Legionella fallonii]CEG56066.1 putative Membrane-fusion protein [Legionella fallonii LLAP-10]